MSLLDLYKRDVNVGELHKTNIHEGYWASVSHSSFYQTNNRSVIERFELTKVADGYMLTCESEDSGPFFNIESFVETPPLAFDVKSQLMISNESVFNKHINDFKNTYDGMLLVLYAILCGQTCGESWKHTRELLDKRHFKNPKDELRHIIKEIPEYLKGLAK